MAETLVGRGLAGPRRTRIGPLHRVIERTSGGRIKSDAVDVSRIDVAALAERLRAAVQGEVRFDDGSRALYATDSSNYRQVPIGVVIPKTRADVIAAVAICRAVGAPLLPRGGGTSLAGECCNTAVVIDFSKYLNRVIHIDPVRRLARVEPGCILDTLRDAAAAHGLTFGPDPATHDHNTLGGMIGNDSGGVHALMNGITVHNVEELDILTYDGLQLRVGPTSAAEIKEIMRAGGRRAAIYRKLDELRQRYGDLIRARFPDIPRRVSGYENLDQLFPEKGFNVARTLVGTEATCVIVLEATLTLIPNPKERALVIMGFSDIFRAADAVPSVLKHGPIGLEGVDQILVDHIRTKHLHEENLDVLPEGHGWLVVELAGDDPEQARQKGQKLVDAFKPQQKVDARLVVDKHQQDSIWKVRDAALGAESYVPNHPDTWPGWEDSAVHRDNLGAYLRELKALFQRYGYNPCVYGHFGDGLVHCSIAFDLYDEPGIEAWRRFLNEATELVIRYNGSLSGEHGDGQARGELLEKMYGPELVEAFRTFKAIWDPEGRMNPGKVVDPFPITSNLRLGPSYHAPSLSTYFKFPQEGSFERAAQRCVGVGKCRRHNSHDEVMCPSYLATHEEKYSTRGRARLLFEMLHGGPIGDRWHSDVVEDALNLCLACKGCKSDCPVHVDMASYKAEFRAHHYGHRLRPRAAYSMGRIHTVSRLASTMPALVNAVLQNRALGPALKSCAGIARERRMPRFANETFTAWFRRRAAQRTGGQRVLLWPDTFNNYFRPQTAIAAVRVLEAAGFTVFIPARPLCCGRPLYDWGWLAPARKLWQRTFATLRPEIEAGTPLIGLEPACVAAFKDELLNLFPGDPSAQRLSRQSVYFSDFIADNPDGLRFRCNGSRAMVHFHCHHHAVIRSAGERRLLDNLGIEHDIIPSGCCGMAGAFGFESDKFETSMRIGERVLLPSVRGAKPDTLIVADGFSCREQIEQATGRATLHAAELAQRCLVH